MLKLNLICVLLITHIFNFASEQITIVGCGYVGLAMAAVFSDSGKKIICIDTDADRIAQLQNKILPLYEPELAEKLFQSNNILFTDDLNSTKQSDIYFLCVPTPPDKNGSCDRTYLYAALKDILEVCNHAATICIKSTVSPGTMRELYNSFQDQEHKNIKLVYNPEFMREGCALQDIRTKNPVIMASETTHDLQKIETFYRELLGNNTNCLITNFETAEIIKYAWNSFSAIRINYVNELATLCQIIGGDISKVVEGIALSEILLPTVALQPGPGYGGSCFPKDTSSFRNLLETYGFASSLVGQAITTNELHKQRLIKSILAFLEPSPDTKTVLELSPETKTVCLLGLSFKANTNDIREAPSIDIIKALQEHGITIKAYDPKAMPNMQQLFPDIQYCQCPYEAIKDSDCIVALTEWEEIRNLDLVKASEHCNKKVMIDTRNLYSTDILKKLGFTYMNMGAL